MTAPQEPDEGDEEVRVGWYSYQGHPHYAHSLDEARALLDHGHVPVDDATAAQAVADATELVLDEPDEGHDEQEFAQAVADEAPKKTPRARRQASQEE